MCMGELRSPDPLVCRSRERHLQGADNRSVQLVQSGYRLGHAAKATSGAAWVAVARSRHSGGHGVVVDPGSMPMVSSPSSTRRAWWLTVRRLDVNRTSGGYGRAGLLARGSLPVPAFPGPRGPQWHSGRLPLTVAGAATDRAPLGSSLPCSLFIRPAWPSGNPSSGWLAEHRCAVKRDVETLVCVAHSEGLLNSNIENLLLPV